MNKKTICIVDDHPIVRQGLRMFIEQQPDLFVSCEAESTREALEVIKKYKPDIALIDLSLQDRSGLELIKDMKSQNIETPVLVVSLHDEAIYAERVLNAGAKGFIMKSAHPDLVMKAIRQILEGHVYISDTMQKNLVKKIVEADTYQAAGLESLSDRELEVFLLIGQGMETKSIAEKLNLGVKTVETHKSRIKNKIGLATGAELTHYAISWFLTGKN